MKVLVDVKTISKENSMNTHTKTHTHKSGMMKYIC